MFMFSLHPNCPPACQPLWADSNNEQCLAGWKLCTKIVTNVIEASVGGSGVGPQVTCVRPQVMVDVSGSDCWPTALALSRLSLDEYVSRLFSVNLVVWTRITRVVNVCYGGSTPWYL